MRVSDGRYFRVTALVREITGMDEDVSVGELDGGIVRVRDADDAGAAEVVGRHVEMSREWETWMVG